MYGSFLTPRKDFNSILSNNYEEFFNILNEKINKKYAIHCILNPGKKSNHILNSLIYSIKGELGYAIWGDGTVNKEINNNINDDGFWSEFTPFPALVHRYFSSYLNKTDGRKGIPNFDKLLIGNFYYKDKNKIVAAGVITDFNVDATRNFIGWKEDTDKNQYFVIKWRMKIFLLHESVRNILYDYLNNKYSKEFFDENDSIELDGYNINDVLGEIRSNTCYKQDNEKDNSILNKILLENKEDIKKTFEFYESIKKDKISLIIEQNQKIQQNIQKINCVNNNPNSDWINHFYIGKDIDINIIKAAMKNGNVLFVGPPGNGKTSLAKNLIYDLIDPQFKNDCFTISTANSLWFRRHVIGGESMDKGNIVWRSGLFIKSYNYAAKINNGNYFVLIDEINRADIDKAFGEFFTIFSSENPNDWEIPSSLINEIKSYGNNIDEDAKQFLNSFDIMGNEPLRKIRIIATMNLVDMRNLFYVGEAILRRFYVFSFNYPENSEDIEIFKKEEPIKNLNEDYIKYIENYITKLRQKEKGEEKNKSNMPNISPASVKKALILFVENFKNNNEKYQEKDVVSLFSKILRSSLGTVDLIKLKNFDNETENYLNNIQKT